MSIITGTEIQLIVKNVDTDKEYTYKTCLVKKRDVSIQHVAIPEACTKNSTTEKLSSDFASPAKHVQKKPKTPRKLINFLPGKSSKAKDDKVKYTWHRLR